ncbi:MAG: PIN domain-containing protein [Deltaproteobacteria bacterium]|nr:PIN domain-containing protein [Deltaproteobacteria bacterium]
MPYLLDTDIYIYLAAGNPRIREKIEEVGEENIFLSAVSVAEIYFGAFRSARVDDNMKKIRRNLEKLQILNFTRHTAKIFGRLKAQAMGTGQPIADLDLAIASIAILHQHTLVTHNTRHFSRLPELLLEDWT